MDLNIRLVQYTIIGDCACFAIRITQHKNMGAVAMKMRNRRQFLSAAGGLAVAAVTAPMISGAAKAQSRSANERLRCAVIGCKSRGGSHISAFSGRKDCEIAYIVDVDCIVNTASRSCVRFWKKYRSDPGLYKART